MGRLHFQDETGFSGSEPSLADMVQQAIRLLQYNSKGYLLVVDAGLSGKASSQNEGERTLREILALDQAVAAALASVDENALLIVAGKNNTGGLRLNGYPFSKDKGAGLLGVNAQGIPSITWSTGPGSGASASAPGNPSTEPTAFKTAASVGTAEDAIATSTGPGSENLTGFKDNTDIFRIILRGL